MTISQLLMIVVNYGYKYLTDFVYSFKNKLILNKYSN